MLKRTVSALLFFSIFLSTVFGLSVKPAFAANPADYLQTSGKDLIYRGQKATLRGVNFDNIPALGADIGTDNMNDINNTAADYALISSFGGNHVRYGVSYSWYAKDKNAFFAKLDQQVAWAKQNNIWMSILTFTNPDGNNSCYEGYSDYCSMWTNTTYQNQLKTFWVDIASRYKDEPTVVGYDLVNEPTPPGPGWCNTWFTLAQSMRNAVAAVAPNQLVFIESCSDPGFNGVFKEADGTTKAKNVVYETHDYDPMSLTHPGWNASGTSATYPGNASVWTDEGEITLFFDKTTYAGSRYPGRYSTAKRYLLDWGNTNAVPVYIGEWGAQGWTNGFRQLLNDKATLYTQLGVNHAYYGWRHDVNDGWRWGLFPWTGALVAPDQAKLDAVKPAWANSVKPNFATSTTGSPTPTPSASAQPTPSPTPSASPVATGQLTLTQPVVLSPSGIITVGTTVTATAKYKNNTNQPIVVQDFVLSGRPPGGTNDDGPYLDFSPHRAGLTMAAGQEVTVTATKTFSANEPVGQWYAYPAWKDNTGFWVDAPANVNTYFTVTNAGASPQPSPTGTPTTESECSRADINQDHAINLSDYSILVSNIFKNPLNNARADINRDTKVDIRDFSIFVRYIFKTCAATSPTPNPTGSGLSVQGTKLTKDGARFVVSGANVEMFRDPGCSDISTGQYAARTAMVNKMKSLGVNAVRLNYSDNFINQGSNLNQFLDVMQAFAQQGIYVMPSTHSYTGESLSSHSQSFSTFQKIVQGARSRGFENMLVMNPYNEPGPQDSWDQWVVANKDTLLYLRNTLNFKGVVVLDTISWAAAFDGTPMLAVKTYDASLLNGQANVVFSNHWYPNIPTISVTTSINASDVVPVVIGELGQINPGSSPLTPSYVTNVLNSVINTGIAKGHNGVFAWIWDWCDENSMTNGDYTTLNTFGNLINNNYYKKLLNPTGSPVPSPSLVPSPTPTVAPSPSPTPAASPTPTPSGSATSLGFSGTKLTNNGNRFIINGVNMEMFRDPGCSDISTGQYAARTAVVNKMKSLGVNAVRMNYSDDFINQGTNLTKFLDVMQLMAQQGMYVMPSTHTYTGNSLSGSAASNATFKKIVDGARTRGFENMLIMNPFNEPGPDDSWAQWVTYNKATVTYLRNTAGFKGLIVLDGLSWAADFNTSSYQQMVSFDAGLLGGTAKIMFSNHWYPNIGLSPVNSSINNSGTVPIVIGELGQINPGSSGLEPQYVKDVFSAVLNGGTAKGHNGIFNWIWSWCDENGMTNDDYTTLNTYGNLVNTNYLVKPK